MAVIFVVMKLRTFLFGRAFNIITDHQALVFFTKNSILYGATLTVVSRFTELLVQYHALSNGFESKEPSLLVNNNVIRDPPAINSRDSRNGRLVV